MKWTQSTPNSALWTYSQLVYHLRIDFYVSQGQDEQDYVMSLQAAAVEFAETAMNTSLITRTITAIFNARIPSWGAGSSAIPYDVDPLYLPRGPVIDVASVTDANGAITNYTREGYGNAEKLMLPNGFTAPLTVVYTAGYGAAADVPADIKQAVRVHVGAMYENRESVNASGVTVVPQSLEAFYKLKSRRVPVC